MVDAGPTRVSRWVTALVLGALLLVAGGGFLVTRIQVTREEERLLHQRASEVDAILTSATNSLASSLRLLGETYGDERVRRTNVDDPGLAFLAAAETLVVGGTTAVGIAEIEERRVVVRAAVGVGLAVGDVLTGARAELAQRALAVDGLASTLIPRNKSSVFVIAIGRPDGLVVFQESVMLRQITASTPDGPFRSLAAVLYRTPQPDPDNLLIATTDELPFEQPFDSRLLTFGTERWLLQTHATSSLAGSGAHAVPWIILGSGLCVAIVMAIGAALLLRRRAYALSLVEQRTADLRAAMDELEQARADCRPGEPGQERVPVADEPRAAHAAERGARLRPAARARRPRRRTSATPSTTSSRAATTCST